MRHGVQRLRRDDELPVLSSFTPLQAVTHERSASMEVVKAAWLIRSYSNLARLYRLQENSAFERDAIRGAATPGARRMFNCVICMLPTPDVCDRCKERHCDEHPCRLNAGPNDLAIIPIVAVTDEDTSSSEPSETVSTEETIQQDAPEVEEKKTDYRTGAVAAFMLAAWIAYATWSERTSEGLGHKRMQALRSIDRFSSILLPAESGAISEKLSVMHWRRFFLTEGFKYGFIPTPMPFPKVFASWADLRLTFRLALFTAFAGADDFARFRQIIDGHRPPRALVQNMAENLVMTRNSFARWGGAGYASGVGSYTAAYSLVVSQLRIPFPFLGGVMNSKVLSLQIPWDAAMLFNHFAVNIGNNARMLRQMNPSTFEQAMSVVRTGIRPVYSGMMGIGLFGVSLGVGISVPLLFKKFWSDNEEK